MRPSIAMSRDRPIGVCLHDVFAAVACWRPAAVFTVTAYTPPPEHVSDRSLLGKSLGKELSVFRPQENSVPGFALLCSSGGTLRKFT